jgi:hypothetical protein
MADEIRLPTKEEIAQLPRWARVAFAARCARLVLPFFRNSWPDAPINSVSIVEESVSKIESYAGEASQPAKGGLRDVDVVSAASNRAPIVAQSVVRVVAAAARAIDDITYYPKGSSAAAAAKLSLSVEPELLTLIRRDFHRLLELSRHQQWTDDTPVPPSVFDLLDDTGDESRSKAFILDTFAPEGTSPHVIGDAMVKLWEAANEYHMARGGGVLTFDEFKQMVPALVPVGPRSEG